MSHTRESIRELLLDTSPVNYKGLVITRGELAAQRGVVALWRNQTCCERNRHKSIGVNGIGFNAWHASAASHLAQWMVGGKSSSLHFVRRVGGTMVFRGEVRSRVGVAGDLAWIYAGQLAEIANENESRG